ncbi:MAG TPA: KH domain-containing protein [Patescibacteria group bacterium]|nr:KH domain-containing protein [Patescibacteria group bacterium]
MKDTLSYIVTAIVDDPKKVAITEEEVDEVTQFTIDVAPEDMGKVIGKNGKVIRSIRNVMKILAMKQNKRINISLTEVQQA